MKKALIFISAILVLSSCGQAMKDRITDHNANTAAMNYELLELALGNTKFKVDSIRYVGTEEGLKLYDVYNHQKDRPHESHIFHTKVDTVADKVVAFKRDNFGWVDYNKKRTAHPEG